MRHDSLKHYASFAADAPIALRFVGLRRSGNHGIISWCVEKSPEAEKVFFNNCKPGHDPFVRFPQVEIAGRREGVYQKKDYIAGLADDPGYLGTVERFFISYEDVDLSMLDNGPGHALSARREKRVGRNVYIVRDFCNWLASFWPHISRQIGHKDLSRPQPARFLAEIFRQAELWKRNYLLARAPDFQARHRLVIARYDDWFRDGAYRRGLLRDLGLPEGDDTIPEVSTFGGGSSFDGLNMKSSPAEMDTTRRWARMLDTPQFRTAMSMCLADDELAALLREEYPESFDALSAALADGA